MAPVVADGDFFLRNAELLRGRLPDLDTSSGGLAWNVEPSRKGGVTLFHEGRWIHSRVDPARESARFFSPPTQRQNHVVVLPGDLLYGLEAWVAAHAGPSLERIVVVFPDAGLLSTCLHVRDLAFLAPWVDRLLISIGEVPLERIDPNRVKGIAWIENPGFGEATRAWARESKDLLLAHVREHFASGLTRFYFEKRWVKNLVANLALPVAGLSAFPKGGGDCVVAGAGPSLDLDWIAKVAGRVPVIATDTSLRPLLQAGVVPAAVLALDGGFYNSLDYEDPPPPGVPLVADVASHPALVRRHPGPVLWVQGAPEGNADEMRARALHDLGFADVPPLLTFGQVTHSAVAFAARCGFRRILLAGFDACWPFLDSHAPGTFHMVWNLGRADRWAPLTGADAKVLFPRARERTPEALGVVAWADPGMGPGASTMEAWVASTRAPVRRIGRAGRRMDGLPLSPEGDFDDATGFLRWGVPERFRQDLVGDRYRGVRDVVRQALQDVEAGRFEFDEAGMRRLAALPLAGSGLGFLFFNLERREGAASPGWEAAVRREVRNYLSLCDAKLGAAIRRLG